MKHKVWYKYKKIVWAGNYQHYIHKSFLSLSSDFKHKQPNTQKYKPWLVTLHPQTTVPRLLSILLSLNLYGKCDACPPKRTRFLAPHRPIYVPSPPSSPSLSFPHLNYKLTSTSYLVPSYTLIIFFLFL